MNYTLTHEKLSTYFSNRGIDIVNSYVCEDHSQVVTTSGLVYEVPQSKHLIYVLEYIDVIAQIDDIIAKTWKRA